MMAEASSSRISMSLAKRMVVGAALALVANSARAAEPDRAKEFAEDIRPVLVEYCGDCHKKNKEVPFLAVTDLDGLGAKRHLWRSVVTQLKHRTMPPPEEDQPEEADRI